MKMKERVYVFDTTLRDGEQAAGSRLGCKEKLRIAQQLERLGVDIIEAGFPCSSPEDYRAVEMISNEVRTPVICGLTRAVDEDIDVCGQALASATRSRIHTGIGVSDFHVAGKFGDPKYGRTIEEKRQRVIEMARAAVKRSRQYTDDVEFYAEDSGRAERSYLFEMIAAVVDAGATVLNIPDTTGYAVPDQFGALIRDICEQFPEVCVSVHCHDDLGLAVSNALAGVRNGARQVEATINGIGERAGNAALEEIVMALKTRSDFYGVETNINTKEFRRTSRMVASAMGLAVPANKAIVGANAFSHSSGIHVDGVLKSRATYEIMDPTDVGMPESRVVLTARTGRSGLEHRLTELGYSLGRDHLRKVYERFLTVADKKREVFDEDLIAIMRDEIHTVEDAVCLTEMQYSSGTAGRPCATVGVTVDGIPHQATAEGDGPVDAMYKAIDDATQLVVHLIKYEIRASTSGTDAMGEVVIQIEEGGVCVNGHGASTDIVEASAKAYVAGINNAIAVRSYPRGAADKSDSAAGRLDP